mmetsp:Transcript_86798/g.232649  ORF Transcript_86798/g.232649 Transcript_86798/m.232649 type:complete len:116 (-) Transcript_86798:121-468(-)
MQDQNISPIITHFSFVLRHMLRENHPSRKDLIDQVVMAQDFVQRYSQGARTCHKEDGEASEFPYFSVKVSTTKTAFYVKIVLPPRNAIQNILDRLCNDWMTGSCPYKSQGKRLAG